MNMDCRSSFKNIIEDALVYSSLFIIGCIILPVYPIYYFTFCYKNNNIDSFIEECLETCIKTFRFIVGSTLFFSICSFIVPLFPLILFYQCCYHGQDSSLLIQFEIRDMILIDFTGVVKRFQNIKKYVTDVIIRGKNYIGKHWDLIRFLLNHVILTAVDIGTDVYQAYQYIFIR